MKILILYPGTLPDSKSNIHCFTDVLGYYLINELGRHTRLTVQEIPRRTPDALVAWFESLVLDGYDAVLAMGLRYFSTVDPRIGRLLQARMWPHGFVCQIHDGSRLDNDPVDITFTLKDDSLKYHFGSDANRFVRHHAYNQYVGWAADHELNQPKQDPNVLSILVDHTNYGPNNVDLTKEVLTDIADFVDGMTWKKRWKQVRVRRFDSGRVVDVDLSQDLSAVVRYDRSATIPYVDITQEHCRADIFCVTHPESVGLVVLETSLAGALPLVPRGFVPQDRLDTVRHIQYDNHIPWDEVLQTLDIASSRQRALSNDWNQVALKIRSALWIRQRVRQRPMHPPLHTEIQDD